MTDINSQRLLDDLRALSTIGAMEDGGVDRVAWTESDLEARRWFGRKLEEAGLQARIDPALNVFGRVADSAGPWLLTGSHLDTVAHGGRLDGAYGAVAALEVLRCLNEQGHPAARRIEVVGFADEEGVRFAGGLFGSQALAGELNPSVLDGNDWQGKPVRKVLSDAGVDPDLVFRSAEHLSHITQYVELHIEQGPRMEADGNDLAVVDAIVGVLRQRVRIEGVQNHAGTTPLALRRDAGRAAVRAVSGLYELVRGIDMEAVANVGSMSFRPGGVNTVPGVAEFDLEIRSVEEPVIRRISDAFVACLQQVCDEERCHATSQVRAMVPPARMEPTVVAAVESACSSLGRTVRLWSGAGHDAGPLSRQVPTAMIFVPSRAGVSHAPEEDTDPKHLVMGARALLRSVLALL